MRILYVEDNAMDGDLTRRRLAQIAPHYQLEVVATVAAAQACLHDPAAYDLVLADLRLPDGSGLDLLAEIRQRKLPLAVVIVTGLGDAEIVVSVLKAGADDYVVKRADYLSRLPLLLEDALAHFRAATARQALPLRVLYADPQTEDVARTRRHMTDHAPHIQLETVAAVGDVMQRLQLSNLLAVKPHPTAGAETTAALDAFPYDIILLDYHLPDAGALELLKEVRQVHQLELPIVLITDQGNEESALQALKLGAADYVIKNAGYLLKLPVVLESAHYRWRLAREQIALTQSAAQLQQQLAMLRAVYAASRQLAGNLAGVADDIVRTCVDTLGAASAWLGRTEPNGHVTLVAHYPAHRGPVQPLPTGSVDAPSGQHPAHDAILTRKPVVLEERSHGTDTDRRQSTVGEAGAGATAALPLISRDLVIGVLLLTSDQPGFFYHERIDFFQTYADHAAAALENSRLYAAAQRYAAELEQRVTERTVELRQSRDELSAANAALARAARYKDEFLASMSHELRTPLSAMMGLAEVLVMGIYGPANPKQQRALRSIEESGSHLLTLINDMLDMAKIEAGKLSLQFTDIAAAEVCQASLNMVNQIAFGKQQRIDLRITPEGLRLVVDVRRVKQILVNLLSNAVKFTPIAGRLGLEVLGDAERQVVHFAVWDEGIGIAAQDIERLFKPFVQLETRRTPEQTGTGLGLSLVLRLTELHGGSVAVTSTPGAGSRFTVTLPWRMASASAQAVVGPMQPVLLPAVAVTQAKGRLLLAEDNQLSFGLVADFLAAHGYAVIPAHNGDEAVARLLELRPDLILMDVQMPETDGLAATEYIRHLEDRALADVPIIALTALAMPGDRERCLAAGMNAYLSKPVDFAALLALIEEYISPLANF